MGVDAKCWVCETEHQHLHTADLLPELTPLPPADNHDKAGAARRTDSWDHK